MVRANRNTPLTPAFTLSLGSVNRAPTDKDVAWDIMPWIGGVSVIDHVRQPASFTFTLASREDKRGMKIWSDDERFVLGASVALSFGYGSTLETLIEGEIKRLEPAFTTGGAPTLTVYGEDLRYLLDTVKRNDAFENLSYSGIAEEICRHQKLDIEAVPSGEPIRHVPQMQMTDLKFLQNLADRIGYELAMRGRTVLFQPRETNKDPVATLTLDDDLLDFHPTLQLVAATRIHVPAWDTVNKKSVSASRGHEGKPGMKGTQSAADEAARIVGDCTELAPTAEVSSEAEAEHLAKVHWDEAALKYLTGQVRCRGRTDIRAGTNITILGVGKRFSGDYYVEGTAHSFTPDAGYETNFRVRRNAS